MQHGQCLQQANLQLEHAAMNLTKVRENFQRHTTTLRQLWIDTTDWISASNRYTTTTFVISI